MTARHARSRRASTFTTLAGFAAVVAAGLAISACGVPLDNAPHPITPATVTTENTTPTTVVPNGSPEVSVYFLNDDRLERQGFPVESDPTISDALDFVVGPPAQGDGPKLRTAVPPSTEVRSVVVTDSIATIDLTDAINDVKDQAQKQAFAQIVFTALAFDEVKQVRFLIDGKVIDAPTDDGNRALISADNYDKPLNPR